MSKRSKRQSFAAREATYRKAIREGEYSGFMPMRWAAKRKGLFVGSIGSYYGFSFVTDVVVKRDDPNTESHKIDKPAPHIFAGARQAVAAVR